MYKIKREILTMKAVSVSTLRAHLPEYIKQVTVAGEEIIITSHGDEVARLSPPHDQKTEARAALQKLRKSAKVGDVLSPVDAPWKANL